jgi:SAM-dependent methyltransferase
MTTLDTTTAGPDGGGIDEAKVEAFTEELFGIYTAGFVSSMIDLGHRTDLFEAATQGPATSAELAERAGLAERYVREWLGAIVTAGIADYDPTTGEYSLPAEHAICLAGESEFNVAPLSLIHGHLAKFIEPVAQAFREGGGVPYSEYRPDFTDVMDGLSRGTFDAVLVDGIVPLAGGLAERLDAGTRVADIGCGTGHTTNLLAQAFSASSFVGYDLADDAITCGRAESSDYGLTNVTFEVLDVTQLPADPPLGAVFAFDAIHDQVDPVTVLDRVFDALEPGGVFVMFDIRASSHLENNVDNPLAPLLYSVSTLHCMTVSLAHDGAGLGTVWGEELALRMLREAGFVDVDVHEIPSDPLNSVYVAHKPA